MVSVISTMILLLTLCTDAVLSECSAGCNSCSGSTCLKCESSYYLSNGFCSACPEECTSCNGYNDCTSCKPGKWGSDNQCLKTCKDSCYNSECQYDNGYCIQCKPGLYGLNCQHDCSYCDGGLCDLRRCRHGCKPGYFEYKIQAESLCQKCPSDCRFCNDASKCKACNDGFYLYQLNSRGKDFVYCVRCSLGSNCSKYCIIQDCNQCQIQDDALVCTDCPKGSTFNGSICIPNTRSCSQECSSYCDDDGICLGSCNAGWTGEKCTYQCSDKCLTCGKSDGHICKQCKGDYYNITCNIACNPSCSRDVGKQTCRIEDGYCLNGCERNFWGPVCDLSCSNGCIDNGLSPICDRSNGICKYGCKDGYNGDYCCYTVTSQTTMMAEAATTTQKQISAQCDIEANCSSKSTFTEGFFSGLGTSVVVVIITVALLQLKRRYIARKLKSHQDSNKTFEIPTYYNEEIVQTNETQEAPNETNNYERLGNTRNTDNVYNDLETTAAQ